MKTDNQKKSILDQIRLSYYNNYLYENGIITENERNKMKNVITSNYHASGKKSNSLTSKKAHGLDR